MLASKQPKAESPPRGTQRLRILCTTDLHMHLTGFDYYTDRPDPAAGLTRLATLIARARAEAGGPVLLFDNGDLAQGTLMGEVARASAAPHPAMQAFAHLGYDAIGLGNHDFNFGLPALARMLADAPCPALCANLTGERPDGLGARAVIERQLPGGETLRIGVFGVIPPQTVLWDADRLLGRVGIRDIVRSGREQARALRRDGCDIVVALAHTGLAADDRGPGAENAARPLAGCSGIDVVIAGHTHRSLPGPDHAGLAAVDTERGAIYGKPSIMAGFGGRALGLLDLDLEKDPKTGWRIASHRAELRQARDVPEDPGLLRLLAPAHAATRRHAAQPVGHTQEPLHSYFSLCRPDPSLAMIAAAQSDALGEAVRQAAPDLPILSAAAPARTGGRGGPLHYADLPAGPLHLRHLWDLQPFPNRIAALLLTGAQIAEWLEWSVSIFHRIAPGSSDAILVDPARPGWNFDTVFGVSYRIDLSRPARYDAAGRIHDPEAKRIADLRLGGSPLHPGTRAAVLVNSYRANGGGDPPGLADAPRLPVPRITVQEAMAAHLAKPSPQPEPPAWEFAPMPGTTALLRTGPGAAAHLGELGGRATALGEDAEGFLRIRLAL